MGYSHDCSYSDGGHYFGGDFEEPLSTISSRPDLSIEFSVICRYAATALLCSYIQNIW